MLKNCKDFNIHSKIVYPEFIPDILLHFLEFMTSNISINYNRTDGINCYGSILHLSVVLSVYAEVCSKCNANTFYENYIDDCTARRHNHKWNREYINIWSYQAPIKEWEKEEDLIELKIDMAENFFKFLVSMQKSNIKIAEFLSLFGVMKYAKENEND